MIQIVKKKIGIQLIEVKVEGKEEERERREGIARKGNGVAMVVVNFVYFC